MGVPAAAEVTVPDTSPGCWANAGTHTSHASTRVTPTARRKRVPWCMSFIARSSSCGSSHGLVLRASLNLRRQEARCRRRALKDASPVNLSRPARIVKKSTNVDRLRDGTDDRQRQDRRRRVERAERAHLVIGREADRGLRHRDEHRHDDPSPSGTGRRPGIGDHKEDEQLVHRTRDRRELGRERRTDQRAACRGEQHIAHHVGQGHVQHPHPGGDQEPEGPDDRIGGEVVPPLVAQDRHAAGRDHEQQADREVARVPEVLAAIGEHVLRGDGQERAQGKRPHQTGPRLEQQRETDAGDVGALQCGAAAPHEPRQRELGRHAPAEADDEAVVAAQDAVARFPHHQDERDEERHQVAGIDLAQPGPERAAPPTQHRERRSGHGSAPVGVGDSVMRLRRSTPACSTTWCAPEGQRITTRSTRVAPPSPKCSRRSFWLAKPIPPSTILSWRVPPASTVTSAPIALRLLRVPTSWNAIQWLPGRTVFSYTSAGWFWFATTTSSTPRLNKSTSATARPSYSSVTPTAAATSVQPARPRLTSTRDRSYPDRLALPTAGQFLASSNRLPFAPATFDIAYQ